MLLTDAPRAAPTSTPYTVIRVVEVVNEFPATTRLSIPPALTAALPLMAAALLIDEPLSLTNVPHLADIATMADLLERLVMPVLIPIRRVVPLVGGVDLSPLVLLLILQIAAIVLGAVQAEALALVA